MHVIVDTNNLFHRLHSVLKSKGTIVDDVAGRNRMISSIFDYSKSIVNKYNYENVWFSIDSEDTWRLKAYDIYKENRKTNNDFVESCIDEFSVRLRAKFGECVLKKDGYESDDIIACVCKINMSKGVSTIIISSDSDLNQLIEFTGFDNPYVLQYDPDANKKYHYMPVPLDTYAPKVNDDLFDDDWMVPAIYEILKGASKVINKHEKIILKIISGDSGDNILSCYRNIKGKTTSIGEAGAKQVMESYPNIEDYEEPNLRQIASKIINVKKSGEINRIDEIVNNLILNKKLIILDEVHIDGYDVLKSYCQTFLNSPPPNNFRNAHV